MPAAEEAGSLLSRWMRWIEKRAVLILTCCVALTAAMFVGVLENLKVDTSTTEMISNEVGFRRNDEAFDRAFPQLEDTIVAVVDAQSPEQADEAAERLAVWLRADSANFSDVYVPGGQRFFRESNLLYLETQELSDLANRLADAQPLLGMLAQDPTLRGLANVITQASAHSHGGGGVGLGRLFGRMTELAQTMEHGGELALSWLSLLGSSGDDGSAHSARRFVIAQPRLDHDLLQPAEAAMSSFRAGIRELDLADRGVVVRLTGSVALDHEELESVQLGGLIAAAAAFILDAILLVLGLRSWWLVIVSVLTLLIGLVWTAAFAIVAVGRLNLISVAFAVLFLGLAVDFSIHLCLRYREEMADAPDRSTALALASNAVGRAIMLSALSAAAGFLSFVPTDYKGLAELGVISAAGMFIAVLANLTVLPALLTLLPLRDFRRNIPSETRSAEELARRYPRVTLIISLALGLLGVASIPFLRFDFDPINLKDPQMESVATFLDLARDPQTTPYSIDILAADLDQAADMARRLRALPEVGQVLTPQSFVPEDQERKLRLIEDIAYFLGPALESIQFNPTLTPHERDLAFAQIKQALDEISAAGGPLAESASSLRIALARLVDREPHTDAVLLELERRLTAYLPIAFEYLREALGARAIGISDLPEDLRSRWVSAEGEARIEVHPARTPMDGEDLRRFADAVQGIVPGAVGTPIIITEAADVVAEAFVSATAVAAVLVIFILIAVLRDLYHVLLVLLPLLLAGALTSLTALALGISLNFANIIALPLLFGVGVSSAIHVVLRWRQGGRGVRPVPSSTSRGVLYSALTTVGAVGTLVLSGHPGMRSMGYLLTIAIGYTLIATLVVLPALIAWIYAESRQVHKD